MNTERIGRALRTASAIRDRIQMMRRKRIEQAFHEAGLGNINMSSLHNSLLSFDEGRPWRGINYSAARRAKWLIETGYEPGRIIDRMYKRLCAEERAAMR